MWSEAPLPQCGGRPYSPLVAFCCISTGVFSFPPDLAAEIAIRTVKEFLQKESGIRRVIFNVFKDSDLEIYRRLLA